MTGQFSGNHFMLKRLALIVVLITTSSAVMAQYDHVKKKRSSVDSRDGRFETSLVLNYQNSINEKTEGGAALNVDSVVGWGIGLGWNWTSKVNLSYKYLSSKPHYLATTIGEDPASEPQVIDHTMTKISHQFNVTYHFMDGAFSPFVIGGVGWVKLDSNIPSEPFQASCWWDPWWGYICAGEWKTFSTTEFVYNLGLGFRWDINNAIFTRGSYSREFIKLKNGSLDLDMAMLEIGLMF